MNKFTETLLTGDVKLALKLSHGIKWLKIILALCICVAYFMNSEWLTEIIVFSVVFILVLPLGFFDVFIQKLLEYNTQGIEDRQLLNANEANKHFESAFNKIKKIEKKISGKNT